MFPHHLLFSLLAVRFASANISGIFLNNVADDIPDSNLTTDCSADDTDTSEMIDAPMLDAAAVVLLRYSQTNRSTVSFGS